MSGGRCRAGKAGACDRCAKIGTARNNDLKDRSYLAIGMRDDRGGRLAKMPVPHPRIEKQSRPLRVFPPKEECTIKGCCSSAFVWLHGHRDL